MAGGIGGSFFNQYSKPLQQIGNTAQQFLQYPTQPTYNSQFLTQLSSFFPQLQSYNPLPTLPSNLSNLIGGQTDARAKALFDQNHVDLAGRGFLNSSEQSRTGAEIAANLARSEADQTLATMNQLGQGNLNALQTGIGAAQGGANTEAGVFGTQAGMYGTQYQGALTLLQQILPMIMSKIQGGGAFGGSTGGAYLPPSIWQNMLNNGGGFGNFLMSLFGNPQQGGAVAPA